MRRRDPRDAKFLLFVGIVNLAFLSVDIVLYVRATKVMKGYGFLLTQIIHTISLCLVICPPALILVWRGHVSKAERAVPWYHFAFIALLYNIELFIGVFPSANLSGPLQSVLGGLRTPITMIISSVLLGARYGRTHLLGALLVVAAVVVETIPKLTSHASSSSSKSDSHMIWLYVLLSIVRMAVPVFVVEEKIVKQYNLGALYMRAMVGLYQMLFSFLLLPLLFIHLPNRAAVAPSDLHNYFKHGFECFFGSGVAPDAEAGVTCSRMWLLWLTFTIMLAVDNTTSLVIRKYGSAALATALGALIIPLSTFVYESRFIAGPAYVSGLSWSTYVALLLAVLGVLVYGIAPEPSRQRHLSITTGTDTGRTRSFFGPTDDEDNVRESTLMRLRQYEEASIDDSTAATPFIPIAYDDSDE